MRSWLRKSRTLKLETNNFYLSGLPAEPTSSARSDVQPDRHDQVEELALLLLTGRFQETRAQRADELDHQLIGTHAVEAVLKKLRIEADLECLTLVVDRHRLRCLAHVGRLSREGDLSSVESQPQRRCSLRQDADPPDHRQQLVPADAQLVFVGLRHKLAIIRELTIYQARREGHPFDPEHDLVVLRRDLASIRAG